MSNKTQLSLTATVNGRNTTDIVDALEAIIKDIQNGHIQGFDSNYTGDYFYDVNEVAKQDEPSNVFQIAA
jgi:hypothetical protein